MTTKLLQWRKAARVYGQNNWVRLANRAGISTAYLDQIAYGYRVPGRELAARIQKATESFPDFPPVTKEQLLFPESAP